MKKKKISSALLLSMACASVVHAAEPATVKEWLPKLPPVLEELGAMPVWTRIKASQKEVSCSLQGVRRSFECIVPKGAPKDDLRAALARKIAVHAKKKFRIPLSHLTLLMTQDDPRSTEDFDGRITRIAEEQLGGRKQQDAIGALWWKLRFGKLSKDNRPLNPERRVMIATKTYEADLKSDRGHAALGWMSLGGDPDRDVILNPGAKNSSDGWETTLPLFHSPEKMNALRVRNLWDWLETQVHDRYLDADILVFALNENQDAALNLLAEKGDRIAYGEAGMLDNNCAHGARQIYNSLLPVTDEIAPLGIVLPDKLMKILPERFREIGRIHISGTPKPLGAKSELINTKVYADRKELRTFKTVREWQTKTVSQQQ